METSSGHPTFLQHYINYLSSDSGLLAIFILSGIVLYAWIESQRPGETSVNIPGCVRFGLYGRSNLDDNTPDTQDGTLPEDQEPRIQALFTYPIKSCRGVELQESEVTGLGLKYDRTFTFAQLVKKPSNSKIDLKDKGDQTHRWRFITQRERPQLAQITTELWIPDPRLQKESSEEDSESDSGDPAVDQINDWTADGGCLIVHFPHTMSIFGIQLYTETVTIKLPLSPTTQRSQLKGYTLEPLSIWIDTPLALNITPEIDPLTLTKLQRFLQISNPLSLFRIDESSNLRSIKRSLPPSHSKESFNVGFGDAFPLSLLSTSSIQALQSSLPPSSRLKGISLSPLRFRANIYISGTTSFDEDTWKRIHLGLAQGSDAVERGTYHIACRTARCTLPNVDPITGERDKKEPFETLKRTRVVDEGAKPHSSLGMSVLPLFDRGIVRVGERVEVLERGVHVYEKMFP